MTWQSTAYGIVLLGVSALMAVSLALVWRRRRSPGGMALVGLLAAMLWWSAAVALESMIVGVTPKVVLSVLSYPGAVSSSVFFYLFCLDYTRNQRWGPHPRSWVWLVPVLVVLAALTNAGHRQLWTSFTQTANNTLIYGHGPVFWLMIGYSYLLLLAGIAALARAIRRNSGVYRRQFATVLVISLFPFVGSIMYILGISPFPYLDPAPIFFALTAVGLTWSLLRQGLLTIVPVAQEALLEDLLDGVLVVDADDRVALANRSMRSWFRLVDDDIGQPLAPLLHDWPELLEMIREERAPGEFRLPGPEPRILDVRPAPLPQRRGGADARIILLRDVTELRRTDQELRNANDQLVDQLSTIQALQETLREQALRDGLTGLFNRRYLEETLDRELARASRESTPLSVAMIDLDRFKLLNDRFGHEAGDRLLRAFGRLLNDTTRAGDIACRYGGEEFLIVFPGVDLPSALERTDELRRLLPGIAQQATGGVVRSTLSAGVAQFPEHGRDSAEVIRAADEALYAAKDAGRDRVVPYSRDLESLQRPGGLAHGTPAT